MIHRNPILDLIQNLHKVEAVLNTATRLLCKIRAAPEKAFDLEGTILTIPKKRISIGLLKKNSMTH